MYGYNKGDMFQLNTLATIADIDLIGSIIYGSNMGDRLHSLATVADIDLIGCTIYGSNMGDMLQLHTLATIADIELIGSTIYGLIWVTCCIP